ncbi:hypothetical protein BcepSauron_414 [Burkholderia phage BcepSauron]|uniref:Superinfection immunity protein n=1 Tax=Burkholderia phage BcepSauron TaxID=2530033 RepID=A0A482MM24_9CAUD|nr:immunity to superinfection [Burkholderia phage BcepSauron]QBQ74794.1 hypothetical protein BcepSauron_414 [Burkholderia phage BcepSauron]
MFGFIVTICVVVMAVVLYTAPTIVAVRRAHPQVTAIAALNIVFGWSLIGWGGALVWAFTNQRKA